MKLFLKYLRIAGSIVYIFLLTMVFLFFHSLLLLPNKGAYDDFNTFLWTTEIASLCQLDRRFYMCKQKIALRWFSPTSTFSLQFDTSFNF